MFTRRTGLVLAFVCTCSLAFAQLKYSNTFVVHPNGNPGGLSVADMNRDGYPDLVVVHSNTLSVYFGVGSGVFQNSIDTQLGSNVVTSDLQTADLNNDGALDVVIAETDTPQLLVLLGNGNGTFRPPIVIPLVNSPREVQLGDFNNDGKVDAAVRECPSSNNDCDIAVYLGNGTGGFSLATVLPAPGAYGFWPSDLAVQDFNRDGRLDLAVAELVGSSSAPAVQFQVYFGNGNGSFKSPVTAHVPYSVPANYAAAPPMLASGDFTGNATPDLGVETGAICGGSACGQSHVLLYLSNGAGGFSYKSSFASSGDSAASGWVAADLNNDLKTDLLRYNSAVMGGTVSTWLNSGSASFSLVSNNDASTAAFAAVRDVNLDGRHDLIQTDWDFGQTDVVVGLNQNGTPNCAPPYSNILSARFCSPGTKVSSTTFTVRAAGNSPSGIKRMELWVDGIKRGQLLDDQLRWTLTLSAGTHKLTIVAVDQYEGYRKVSEYVTVP